MEQSRIKYHYARNAAGRVIDIANVAENDRQNKYYCLNCGNEMTPRLGHKNAHHFAHKTTTPNCNPETYLHKLAKLKIKEKFDSGLPFEITILQVSGCLDKCLCPFHKEDECKSKGYKTYDLHKTYDTCLEEQTVGTFRADLLLTSSAKTNTPPILIEIRVTHKCDEAKINYGEKIIEIEINNEEDIARLLHSPIKESERCSFDKEAIQCTFHNLKRTVSDTKLKMRSISKFYLYKSGLAHITYIDDSPSCREVWRKDQPKAVLELGIDTFYLGQLTVYDIGYAKAEKMGFKNCFCCKYRKDAFDSYMQVPSICCLYKKYGTPQYPNGSEAMSCQYYKLNHENESLLKEALETTAIIVCE